MAKKKTTLLMKTPKSPCSLQLSGGMRIMFLKYLRKGLLILSLLVTGCQNVSGQPLPGLKTTEPRIINTPLTPNENSTQLIPTLRLTEELTMEPTGTLEVNRALSFANIKPGQYLLISVSDGYGNASLY